MRSALAATVMLVSTLPGCSGPEREGVEEVFNFTPLAYYEKSESPPGYSVDVLWPIFNVYRAGDAHGSRLFPLYSSDVLGPDRTNFRFLLLYGAEETAEASHRELFPLFWHTSSKTNPDWSTTRVLFALLGAIHDKDYSNHWFFPFYFDRDSADIDTFTLWPFYGFADHRFGEADESHSWHVAWPLFRFGHSTVDDHREAHVLSFDLLGGIFDRSHRHHAATDQTPEWKHDSTILGWVLPLFSIFETTDRGTEGGTRVLSLLNGRLRRHFNPNLRDDGLGDLTSLIATSWEDDQEGAPLRRHSHVFPLYSSTNSTTDGNDLWVLPPVYRHRANPSAESTSHDLLGGLWSYGTSGSGETLNRHWRVLPLLWFTTRPETKTHLVLPLYYHLADAENDYLHVIPFYGKNTEANGKATKTFVLTPLYIGTRDERTDLTRTDLLFPLISWQSSVEGSSSRFSPFWLYEERAARTHWNFLVVADHTRSEIESATMVYPFYSEREVRGEGRWRSLLPFFDFLRYTRSAVPTGDEFAVLFPLASFRSEGTEYKRHVFPFYWWRDDGAGHSVKAIWPIYGISRDSDFTMHSTLWPFFRFGSSESGDRSEVHLLSPLFAHTHERDGEQEGNHSRFFPLYWWSSGRGTEGPWSDGWVLWPLWRYEAKRSGEVCAHSLFKLGEYERSPDGTVEQFSILHALYRYRREGAHETRSVPFLYRYEREGDRATLHLFHFIPIEF